VSESTYPVVLADLEGKLPDTKNVVLQYYNWHKGAGISPHGDESYRFGATVYLNESWNPAWGGIFHWKDSFGEQKTFLPEFNSLVLNDEQEEHWVTNVSRKAPYCRKTLQIWGLFK
jgi:Rps23 Pro-64 3,4-dihydroxylase Tpa1-like proline 4-hydroxylase